MQKYFEVGQIVNTFGINGVVKVKPFTDEIERFEELKFVLIEKNNQLVKYEIKERRPGDIDACYADPSYAYEKLGWKAEKDINEMCLDAYNFVKKD